MKKLFRKKYLPLFVTAATLCLSSCTNNDYDLSDIDTTVGVNVKELTIPLNLDVITLDAMLDMDENSQIKKQENGEYAVVESGTFHSSTIKVPGFTAAAPSITPIEDELHMSNSFGGIIVMSTRAASGQLLVSYDLSDKSTDIHYEANDVDASIVSIERVGVNDLQMTIRMSFNGLQSVVDEIQLENVVMQFIPGLTASLNVGSYDPETGKIQINEAATTNHAFTFQLTVSALDKSAGIQLNDGCFTMDAILKATDGKICIYDSNVLPAYRNNDGTVDLEAFCEALPATVKYVCAPKMSNIEIQNFSGQIQYDIDGINIDPIDLSDIPEVLNQTGTDIRLANPQIYFESTNPLHTYGLYAMANLRLTSYQGSVVKDYTLDNPEGIRLGAANNQYCISPKKPDTYYKGQIEDGAGKIDVDFSAASHEAFSTLGNVLSGEKIPESVGIEVVNPNIPVQSVNNFQLNTNIEPVDGKWVFYAPLQLTSESRIKYVTTMDGWNDDELDALIISKITVLAECATDLPLKADFYAYPLDVNGNKICHPNGSPIVAKVNKQLYENMSEPIEISVEGDIRHLDGIQLEATLLGTDGNSPLKPTQTIQLKNMKIKVSGSYEKEL